MIKMVQDVVYQPSVTQYILLRHPNPPTHPTTHSNPKGDMGGGVDTTGPPHGHAE